MNLIDAKAINELQSDLSDILSRYNTEQQIVTAFTNYLMNAMHYRKIEDYSFKPPVITTQSITVDLHVVFPWDLQGSHDFVIKKKDSPSLAYSRAMGVI